VATPALNPKHLLRWIYLGRFALVTGMLLGALAVWGEAQPEQTFLATVMFLVGSGSVAASAGPAGASSWRRWPSTPSS
jgi:hypothetical protein